MFNNTSVIPNTLRFTDEVWAWNSSSVLVFMSFHNWFYSYGYWRVVCLVLTLEKTYTIAKVERVYLNWINSTAKSLGFVYDLLVPQAHSLHLCTMFHSHHLQKIPSWSHQGIELLYYRLGDASRIDQMQTQTPPYHLDASYAKSAIISKQSE